MIHNLKVSDFHLYTLKTEQSYSQSLFFIEVTPNSFKVKPSAY